MAVLAGTSSGGTSSNRCEAGMDRVRRTTSPLPSIITVPPRRKKGTSEPREAAKGIRSSRPRPKDQSSFRALRVAAASLLPPPRPAAIGMDLSKYISAPPG